MTQMNPGDWPIVPASTSGPDLATKLNMLVAAVCSTFRGSTRPPNATAGMTWVRLNPDGSHTFLLYDGTTDTAIFNVDVGGNITVSNTMTSAQTTTAINTAVNSAVAGVPAQVKGGTYINASISGSTVTLNHADTSSMGNAGLSPSYMVSAVTLDGAGHVTDFTRYNLDGNYYNKGSADSRYMRRNSTGYCEGYVSGTRFNARNSGSPTDVAYAMSNNNRYGMYFNNGRIGFSENGTIVGEFNDNGTGTTDNNTIITRTKGDARYIRAGQGGSVKGSCRMSSAGSTSYRRGIVTGGRRVTTGRYKVQYNSDSGACPIITPVSTSTSPRILHINNVGSTEVEWRVETRDGTLIDCGANLIIA